MDQVPTIYDARRRSVLLERMLRLTPVTYPHWGRMDASRMVCHLLEAFRMRTGELRIRRRFVPLRPLVRWLLIYKLPFPKGAPTARELLIRPARSFAEDHGALCAAIVSCVEPAADAPRGDHPIFGDMSVRDWGVLMYKHTDHHLRQFGL
jgi:hypothetical protein